MSELEKQAMLAIRIHAAFADGAKHDRKRAELRRVLAVKMVRLRPRVGG